MHGTRHRLRRSLTLRQLCSGSQRSLMLGCGKLLLLGPQGLLGHTQQNRAAVAMSAANHACAPVANDTAWPPGRQHWLRSPTPQILPQILRRILPQILALFRMVPSVGVHWERPMPTAHYKRSCRKRATDAAQARCCCSFSSAAVSSFGVGCPWSACATATGRHARVVLWTDSGGVAGPCKNFRSNRGVWPSLSALPASLLPPSPNLQGRHTCVASCALEERSSRLCWCCSSSPSTSYTRSIAWACAAEGTREVQWPWLRFQRWHRDDSRPAVVLAAASAVCAAQVQPAVSAVPPSVRAVVHAEVCVCVCVWVCVCARARKDVDADADRDADADA